MTEQEYLDTQLTPHFKRSEFACKCRARKKNNGKGYCSPIHCNPDPRLVEICEIIREYIGEPLIINSACRCDKYNKDVGGVDSSSHRWGFAVDLSAKCGSEKLFKAIQELYKAGKLPYLRYVQRYIKKDFCHIDIDVNKKRKNMFATVA